MYHLQDFMSHVEDLSTNLARLMVAHHGPGFRENCALVVAYARTMRCLPIRDQRPLLVNLRPGGVSSIKFAATEEPPITTSEDELSDETM